MCIFQKTNVSTQLHKNGHNFTYDQYFFMKFAPLDSAHIARAINQCQKLGFSEKLQMVYFSIAGHILY